MVIAKQSTWNKITYLKRIYKTILLENQPSKENLIRSNQKY